MLFSIIFVFASLACSSESSNILGIFWTPSRSHHILGSALLQALAKKGHNVNLLSSFIDDVNISNFKQTKLEGMNDNTFINTITNPNTTFIQRTMKFFSAMDEFTGKLWENQPIRELLSRKPEEEKYDVAIVIAFFNDALFGLCHHLKVPVIMFSPTGSIPIMNKFVANPNLPYGTDLQMSFATPRTFVGRLASTSLNLFFGAVEQLFIIPKEQQILDTYFPGSPTIRELQKNISLVLVNSHHSIEAPRPYVPNMVQIGGFYAQNVNKLPTDLQNYLDAAKAGFVYFSFGTNLKLATLDKDKLEIILSLLGQITQLKVLFKSEIEFESVPKNVLIRKWFPQKDVLAHPNAKAFISHGGLGSTTEAVYHGVPMLGIPMFADQKTNIALAKEAGYAVTLLYEEITEQTFRDALAEILNNPSYSKSAKQRSSLLRNQPMNPLDKAIWWVEHIIEYKGGKHLKNVAMDLEWYQLYLVDVVLFYTFSVLILTIFMFYTIKFMVKKCMKSVLRRIKEKQN